MSEQTPRAPEAVSASFSEHLHAFYDGLPPDEQTLLERLVALAEAAADEQDTAGYNAGKVQFQDLSFVIRVNKASPKLF